MLFLQMVITTKETLEDHSVKVKVCTSGKMGGSMKVVMSMIIEKDKVVFSIPVGRYLLESITSRNGMAWDCSHSVTVVTMMVNGLILPIMDMEN